MVDIEQHGDEVRVLLRPNRSMSWRANQYIFLGMTLWLGSFALGFAAMGAWVILPFVGLELIALASALYYVSWKLSHQEVLHITPEAVSVTKGTAQPKDSWTLPREHLVVHVSAASHPWGTPTIQLISRCPTVVRVGEFLNQQDCKTLLGYLVSARLATRHSRERVKVAF